VQHSSDIIEREGLGLSIGAQCQLFAAIATMMCDRANVGFRETPLRSIDDV
tara:strand:- start:8797 stop:8949 length:153 start_codon:yes stop_codon:yes gene_type:complete